MKYKTLTIYFYFFWEVGPNWDPRTQVRWPIALYLSFKFIEGYLGVQPPYRRTTIPLSLASFICSGSILAKLNVCILTFSNTRHSHRMCTDVSFSAPHLLHDGVFARLVLCSITADWYARLGALPTFCNVFSPVYLWTEHTYQLVPPDTVAGPILFTNFSYCLFPFFNPTPYFGLKST